MTTQPWQLSVKVVLRDADGRRLVLRRSRRSKGNPDKWEFPGGKVDSAERIDAALLREVSEELGIRIELEQVVGSAESKVRGKSVAYIFFEARYISGQVRISEEHEAYRWVTLEELLALKDLASQFQGFAQSYCRSHGYSRHKPEPARRPPSLKELHRQVRKFENSPALSCGSSSATATTPTRSWSSSSKRT